MPNYSMQFRTFFESAEDALRRIQASPNQPHDRDWDKYAERWNVRGDFVALRVPTETLVKMVNGGQLYLSRHTDRKEIDFRKQTGARNPVIVTNAQGRLTVLDGSHSLVAAAEAQDRLVDVLTNSPEAFGVQPTA